MQSPSMAGLIAAVPLAVILAVYVVVRGKALVTFFQSRSPQIAQVPEKTLWWIILLCFVGAAFLLGILGGLVYGWLGMPRFAYVALGATVLLSVLAVISRTPLAGDKIVWNIAVGGVLGVLIPLLGQ